MPRPQTPKPKKVMPPGRRPRGRPRGGVAIVDDPDRFIVATLAAATWFLNFPSPAGLAAQMIETAQGDDPRNTIEIDRKSVIHGVEMIEISFTRGASSPSARNRRESLVRKLKLFEGRINDGAVSAADLQFFASSTLMIAIMVTGVTADIRAGARDDLVRNGWSDSALRFVDLLSDIHVALRGLNPIADLVAEN